MVAFLYRANSGIAGDVTRPDQTIIEPGFLDATSPPTAFGVPVVAASGKFRAVASGDTADSVYGIISRVVPSIAGDAQQTFYTATPNPDTAQGIVVRGYINVTCTVGTPVRGNPVYMRVVAAAGAAIGDLEATADGVNNVALPNVVWSVDGKDANNVTEIRIY